MSTSQTIRYATPNLDDPINPTHIVADLVRITDQLFGAGSPAANLGVIGNVYTDVTTGFQYQKHGDGWDATIALGSFAVIPDPLAVNELDVNTIKGRSSADIQINLGVGGDLSIGPAAALSTVQILSSGTIITDSATSNVIVSDTVNQTTYGSVGITGNQNIAVVANNLLSLTTNVSDINIAAANGVNVTSGAVDIMFSSANSNVFNALTANQLKIGGTTYLSTQGGNIDALVPILSNIAGSPQYSSLVDTSSGMEVIGGATRFYSGGVPTLLTSAAQLFVGSSAIDNQSGSVGVPSYSFAADTTSGIYLNGAGNPVMSAAGGAVMGWVAGSTQSMGHIIPVSNNTYDLGTSAPLAYRNIYSNNVLNVVSDERRKKDIEALAPGLDLIENLCPVSFRFKDSSDERFKIGFIAQSTEAVMKEYDKDYDIVNYDEPNDSYTMKYESLIGVLVKAVQELSQEVKDLKSKSN